MNWKKLVTTPPPTTCWNLDSSVIASIRKDGKGMLHWAADAAPADLFEVGPVGLQSVHRERLATTVGSVQGRIQGAARAAAVVPTGWFRTYLLEFDELPRKPAELDQVVQWRLKKLLPVLPSELRLSSVPLRARDGVRPLLTVVGVEKAIAGLEEAFATAGVELGLITSRLFALAGNGGEATRMLVQQERGFLSLLLLVNDAPRLVRTKPLAEGVGPSEKIVRELNLMMRFIREDLAVEEDIEIELSVEDANLVDGLEEWCTEQAGVHRSGRTTPPAFNQPGAAERLGPARTAPLCNLIMEAAE